jgi:ribosomal protection tetracycline resistance protein
LLRRTLNLGILAHVDAGKTTLTERLLYEAGVIRVLGRVDDGTTQTDTMALEQERGITIKSAVVSFEIRDVRVNLIDTPGHPDFIAEVERVLGVLDGAVLVISAVEGVQAQTPLLMRALRRLEVPTILFLNKTDRRGADPPRVLREIEERLTPAVAPVDSADDVLSALAENDEALLAAYVDGDGITPGRLREELAAQTARSLVHPVFVGSAKTGEGIDELMSGIAELLPARAGDADAPLSGTVFKVDRGRGGEKIAYARLFAGTVRVRDRLGENQKITALSVFDGGDAVPSPEAVAGQIAQLWGLAEIRVGDAIGEPPRGARHRFAPPTLESVVVPVRPKDKAALHTALTQLEQQDPLINLRQSRDSRELFVSLYGEVQKEVIQATLARDFGVEAEFRETTMICVERPVRAGKAVEILNTDSNPFRATIGLRVEPAPAGSGREFRAEVDPRTMPLYLFKTLESFVEHMEQFVMGTLREGLHGWQVTDCLVTMTRCGYSVPDGPPSRRGPLSTSADFRKLTPLVLMDALKRAGTVVCEPIDRFHLGLPAEALGVVLPALIKLHAVPDSPETRGSWAILEGDVPAAHANELQQRLRGLTHGEGVVELAFDRYEPVTPPVPERPRTDDNPLDRREYLFRVTRSHLVPGDSRGAS